VKTRKLKFAPNRREVK